MQPRLQQGYQAASEEVALGKLKVGPCGASGKGGMLQGVGEGDAQSLLPAVPGNREPPGPSGDAHGQGAPVSPGAFFLPPAP